MRPYSDVTQATQVRRLRALATTALACWGVRKAKLTLLQHSDTTTFRVDGAKVPGVVACEPYPIDRFALRLHRPGYESEVSIASELAWLAAIADDTELVAPRAVPALDGAQIVRGAVPATSERLCTLMRWVPGRQTRRDSTPADFRRLGRCMAVLHEHARSWSRPPAFRRRKWDADGIFGAANLTFDTPGHGVRDLIPSPHARVFERAIGLVEQAMSELGREPEVWRVLHADLHPGHIPVRGRALQVIDFADCGEGHLVYDFAVPLEYERRSEIWGALKDALFAGYASRARLPEEQLVHLEAFMVARGIGNAIWLAGVAPEHAQYAAMLDDYVERQARIARAFLDG